MSDCLVSLLGAAPGEEDPHPTLALRTLKRPDGTRPVLRLKPGSQTEAEALADTINQSCERLFRSRRDADDRAPVGQTRVRVVDPPGKDDVSPSHLEIVTPDTDVTVQLELKHHLTWSQSRDLAARIAALAMAYEDLPPRRRR